MEADAAEAEVTIGKALARFNAIPLGPVRLLIIRRPGFVPDSGDLPPAYWEFESPKLTKSVVATNAAGQEMVFDVRAVADAPDAVRLFMGAASWAGDRLAEHLTRTRCLDRGFAVQPAEWRWLLAITRAAGKQLLGTDGFTRTPSRYSPGLGISVDAITIARATRGDVPEVLKGIAQIDFTDNLYMVISDARAASVALCEHLADAASPPAEPPQRGDTTNDRLCRLYAENWQAAVIDLTQKQIAREIGRSEAAIAATPFWRDHLKKERAKIAGTVARRKHLRAKLRSGKITNDEIDDLAKLDEGLDEYADDIDRDG